MSHSDELEAMAGILSQTLSSETDELYARLVELIRDFRELGKRKPLAFTSGELVIRIRAPYAGEPATRLLVDDEKPPRDEELPTMRLHTKAPSNGAAPLPTDERGKLVALYAEALTDRELAELDRKRDPKDKRSPETARDTIKQRRKALGITKSPGRPKAKKGDR
jgi:hypothetical protein